MAKCNLTKKWKDAKAEFKDAVGKKKPGAGTIKILGHAVRRGSGIEKALSNFDSAVNKGHRKDAALAYQVYWRLAGEYGPYLAEASNKVDPQDKEFDGLAKLGIALGAISQAAEIALKEIIAKKGPALEVHQFLADIEGQLNLFKAAIKKDKMSQSAEKDYKLLPAAQGLVKPLKEYTIGASRGDAQKALDGLDDFIEVAKKFKSNSKKVLDLIGTMPEYRSYADGLRSMIRLCDEMRRVRVDLSRKELQKVIDGNED